jgi:DNA-binding Lrp family transcriptional regulator
VAYLVYFFALFGVRAFFGLINRLVHNNYVKLDSLDHNLLKHLQDDGRLSLRRLGTMLGVPHTTVFSRINKLVKNGVIKHFSAVLNPHDLGLKMNMVVIDAPEDESNSIASQLSECEEVLKVYRTGDGRLLAKTVSDSDYPACIRQLFPDSSSIPVEIMPIEEVVKYDHRISHEFVKKL